MQSNWMIVPENDDLMHYKYIDKIKTKTGKWRYVYSKAADKIKNAGNNIVRALRKNKTTNKGNPDGQYSPTIKKLDPIKNPVYQDDLNKGISLHQVTKGYTEPTSLYNHVLNSHRKTTVTNSANPYAWEAEGESQYPKVSQSYKPTKNMRTNESKKHTNNPYTPETPRDRARAWLNSRGMEHPDDVLSRQNKAGTSVTVKKKKKK